jgi:hypothetical protein
MDQRDNLIAELKNAANDVLDQVNRISSKQKSVDDKLKELKNLTFEKKTIDTNIQVSEPVIKYAPVPKREDDQPKKDSSGSFFDSIE